MSVSCGKLQTVVKSTALVSANVFSFILSALKYVKLKKNVLKSSGDEIELVPQIKLFDGSP